MWRRRAKCYIIPIIGLPSSLTGFEVGVLISSMVGGGAEVLPSGLVIQNGEVIGRMSLAALNVDLTCPNLRDEIFTRALVQTDRVTVLA